MERRKICGVTEHTDERSLAHYLSDPSAAEKRNHSAILITAVAGECSPVVSSGFIKKRTQQQQRMS